MFLSKNCILQDLVSKKQAFQSKGDKKKDGELCKIDNFDIQLLEPKVQSSNPALVEVSQGSESQLN